MGGMLARAGASSRGLGGWTRRSRRLGKTSGGNGCSETEKDDWVKVVGGPGGIGGRLNGEIGRNTLSLLVVETKINSFCPVILFDSGGEKNKC